MGKKLAMAMLGAVSMLGVVSAQAQSSVTVYGRVNMGYTTWTNDSKGAILEQESDNRLGFVGAEQISNDLQAVFQLEARFSLDTGQLDKVGNNTNTLFKDKSWVGLKSKSYGTILLGRVHSVANDLYHGGYEAFGSDTIGLFPLRRAKAQTMWNNGVRYDSPAWGDMFVASLGMAVPETSSGGKSPWGAGGTFMYSGFKAALQYQHDVWKDGSDLQSGLDFVMYSNPFNTWSLAMIYNFGSVDLVGGYAYSQGYNVYAIQNGKARMARYQMGVTARFGQGHEVHANVGHGTETDAADQKVPDFTHVGLGYWYYLSKRTILMANAAYQQQDGMYDGHDDKIGVQVAVRHSF